METKNKKKFSIFTPQIHRQLNTFFRKKNSIFFRNSKFKRTKYKTQLLKLKRSKKKKQIKICRQKTVKFCSFSSSLIVLLNMKEGGEKKRLNIYIKFSI